MRKDFVEVVTVTGAGVDPIELSKDIIPSPEEQIRGHPAGCQCPECAGADLGSGQEADLTAPVTNYTHSQPDHGVDIPSPDQDIAGHPAGCQCPECAGADLGSGQAADLSSASNDYSVGQDNSLGIPAPQVLTADENIEIAAAESDLGIPAPGDGGLNIPPPQRGSGPKLQPAA